MIAIHIVTLGLVVFLFGVVSHARPILRVRFWSVAWIFVLVHAAVELWMPTSPLCQHIQEFLAVSTLVLAGLCLVLSNVVAHESCRVTLYVSVQLGILSLLCSVCAVFAPDTLWVLYGLAALWSVANIASCVRLLLLRNQRSLLTTLLATYTLGAIWMFIAIREQQPRILIHAILSELFISAAVSFWFDRNLHHGVGFKATCVSLLIWGTIIPAEIAAQHAWPQVSFSPEIWNIPTLGTVIGMMLMLLDEDTYAARALTEEYRLTFDSNPHPLWIFDVQTLELLNVNQAALDKHGYTREEFLRLRLVDILAQAQTPGTLRENGPTVKTGNRISQHIRKDGSILPMDITVHDTIFHGRRARFVLGIDVTEREMLHRILVHQNGHDTLTGLSSRRLFNSQLAEAVKQSLERDEKVAVLCLDIDRFQQFNNAYGHAVGDECLRRVAAILSSNVRSTDIVARTGGAEFGLILRSLNSGVVAQRTATDLMDICARPFIISGNKLRISLSGGLAVCPDDETDVDALWRGAESALYQAKAAGGGQNVWLSPELSSASGEQIELEAYMRAQLEENGFRLMYQPIYGLDGVVHSLEALLRLDHPKYGALSPAKFIPVAESSGLIVMIGDWVVEEVCRQLSAWNRQGMRMIPVAVNVSGLQLMQSGFADRVMGTLRRFDIDPHWIELEVTESVAMLEITQASKQMKVLSERGIRFAMDDFGTGHSSLGRLDQLPICQLKIDRVFIERLRLRTGMYSIVQTIMSMAKTFGLDVVAEGVDREEQIECLRQLGCDYLQGFLLSRPVKAEAIQFLVEHVHPIFAKLPVSSAPDSLSTEIEANDASQKTQR